MATEIARLSVVAGAEAAFESAARKAVALFRSAGGCRSMTLLRSHEDGSGYWLIVEWTDVAAHAAFRASPGFAEWRSLVGDCFAGAPSVEHGITTGIGF